MSLFTQRKNITYVYSLRISDLTMPVLPSYRLCPHWATLASFILTNFDMSLLENLDTSTSSQISNCDGIVL